MVTSRTGKSMALSQVAAFNQLGNVAEIDDDFRALLAAAHDGLESKSHILLNHGSLEGIGIEDMIPAAPRLIFRNA